MRTKLSFLLISFLVVIKCFSQNKSYLDRLQVLRDYGYSISDQKKVNCREGGEGYSYRTFYRGVTYVIVGSSDDLDVSDVDLYLYDSDGVTILRRDTEVSNLAILNFTPNYDVTLKIVIKNYKSDTPNFASTCRFVVAYK